MRLGSFFAALAIFATGFQAQAFEISGDISIQSRKYSQSVTAKGQRSSTHILSVAPTVHGDIAENSSIVISPYFRYDSTESKSTHTDLREAYLLMYGDWEENSWEIRLGFDSVFWGVAEVHNLVDIVNQVDLIDHPRDRPKLGQPMAHLTVFGDWGTAEAFLLPYHRKRSFAGRLVSGLASFPIAEYSLYESGAEQRHVDFAFRYSHSVGLADFGLSAFAGTSREPTFILSNQSDTPSQQGSILIPYYEQIRQFGIDVQLTTESLLYKMEAIHRRGMRNILGKEENYSAAVLGLERTVYEPLGSQADLTLISEWLYDNREHRTIGNWQNDLYLAGFLNFNDVNGTELSAGIVEDLDRNEHTWNLEFKRRMSNNWSMRLEALGDRFVGMNFTFGF